MTTSIEPRRLGFEIAGRIWEVLTRPIDRFLFGITMTIVAVGMVTLFSAADQSAVRVGSQLTSLAVALVAMWVMANLRFMSTRPGWLLSQYEAGGPMTR